MTWDELTDLLTELGDDYDVNVRRVGPPHGPEAIFMHIVPVAWFSSMRIFPTLNIGVYEGDENRLVGTEQIPLAELTPEFVRERVDAAVAATGPQVVLDPDVMRHVVEVIQKQRSRDLDPERFRDVDQSASREQP